MTLQEILPKDLSENAIKLIGLDWMLIASGKKDNYNMMTASWGGLGVLWHKPVCFIFIRPSRYTYQFIEKNDFFSLNFFDQKHRAELNICGSKSGREIDKMKEVNLSAVEDDNTIYFSESRLVFLCKKIYQHQIAAENFLSPLKDDFYKDNNYHRMFIGEIVKCLQRIE